ncbi:MAG: ATP-binding protein [Ruminococcus sp.]|nr:ATP-binding protein [Ruminococcus sp.]
MKRLQRKLICIVFLAVSGVFLAVFFITFISFSYYNTSQADSMTQIISLNDGLVPNIQEYKNNNYSEVLPYLKINEESEFETRYFVVYFNEDDEAENVNMEHVASVSWDDAVEMGETVLADEKDTGYYGQYRYRITSGTNGTFAVFLDCSDDFASRSVVMGIVGITAIVIIILITVIFGICAKRVVKPFAENAAQQKQFITDASHELKTPLAIISANAEVLQYKNGSNDWTQNIITQTKRMSKLISDLLSLSKMDELNENMVMESVDLSALAAKTVESFQEVIGQKNVRMETSITPDITVKGNTEQLKQMISILSENASKYVTQDGLIKASLTASGKRVTFRIENTADIEEDLDCKRLFDRFYRPDNSRSSETGGHGIGLSIAQKIATRHGGSLTAEKTEIGICFVAEIMKNAM